MELVGILLVFIAIPFSIKILLVLPVLDINCESFRDEEPKPLESLGIRTSLGKGILPVRDTQVHYHKTEVIREAVRQEEPVAA